MHHFSLYHSGAVCHQGKILEWPAGEHESAEHQVYGLRLYPIWMISSPQTGRPQPMWTRVMIQSMISAAFCIKTGMQSCSNWGLLTHWPSTGPTNPGRPWSAWAADPEVQCGKCWARNLLEPCKRRRQCVPWGWCTALAFPPIAHTSCRASLGVSSALHWWAKISWPATSDTGQIRGHCSSWCWGRTYISIDTCYQICYHGLSFLKHDPPSRASFTCTTDVHTSIKKEENAIH